jgi:hypothetical protein
MDERTSVLSQLAQAMARESATDPLPHRLCRSATSLLGADGAAITLAYTARERVTLCVTDDRAARLEDLQDLLGEGPGPTAYRTGRQVHVLIGDGDHRWPQFESSAQQAFGSINVHAIPIKPNHMTLGVFTAHVRLGQPLLLSAVTVQFLADAVGVALLRDPASHLGEPMSPTDQGDAGPWSSRSRIHQATGMVVAQLGIDADDALALMRAHAFASGTSLDDVASAVTQRVLDFSQIHDDSTGSTDS